jgi:predicted lysophospholipase L1 biosynthesis ABC-type transport system permease subunit
VSGNVEHRSQGNGIFALSPAVWHGDEMRWGIVLAIAVLAGVAGAVVWYLIARVFDPPGFVNLIFVAVVTLVVGRTLLPLAAKNRGRGERG